MNNKKTLTLAVALLTLTGAAVGNTYVAPIPLDFPKPEAITIFCYEGVLYLSNAKGMTHAVDRAGKPLPCQGPKQ